MTSLPKTAIPRLSCLWVSHQLAKHRVYNAATGLSTRSHYSYAGPGHFHGTDDSYADHWKERQWTQRGFTVGIGGPVGSGKTALVLKLTKEWSKTLSQTQLGVVTNDIFTQEDAEFLTRNKALPAERIAAVETGGCPHAAIREDVSANLGELERLTKTIQKEVNDDQVVPLLLCESGGDNLAANFSRELADLTLYVIDVSGGDKIPRKGGPGITQSDLLIINKIDIAEAVGSSLDVMKRDGEKMRGTGGGEVGPMVFCSVKQGTRVEDISDFIMKMYEKATGKQAL